MEARKAPHGQTDRRVDVGAPWWRDGVALFSEATGWIVIPLIAALYGGQYLDEVQGTGSLYFLSLTAFAFIISCIGIGMVGVKYIRKIEAEKKDKPHGDASTHQS